MKLNWKYSVYKEKILGYQVEENREENVVL